MRALTKWAVSSFQLFSVAVGGRRGGKKEARLGWMGEKKNCSKEDEAVEACLSLAPAPIFNLLLLGFDESQSRC